MIALGVLEAHRLRARLLLRHVVHAEELVVAEEQPVHPRHLSVSAGSPPMPAREPFRVTEAVVPGTAPAEVVRGPMRGVALDHVEDQVGLERGGEGVDVVGPARSSMRSTK